MSWATPKYGRKTLYKAGKVLISKDKSLHQYEDALEKLDNFRSSHAYPLTHIRTLLKRKAKEVDSNAFVAQRLKRIPSIIGKLQRFPSMQLGKIQDIGGCRAVVTTTEQAYELSNRIVYSNTKCILEKKNDYIENPKNSGYRGIHLIYKYIATSNKNICFNNLKIEIQIRTEIQHAWATSVEILGTFLGQSLKTGEGDKDWLNFFKTISNAFKLIEDGKSIPDNFREIIQNLENNLKISDKLRAFSHSIKIIDEELDENCNYCILKLDTHAGTLAIYGHKTNIVQNVTDEYIRIEKEFNNHPHVNVVLVATDSVSDIKKAYPNYFADSRYFVQLLHLILDINN